jgi:thiamine biosynthesis lipoprotein ApbE
MASSGISEQGEHIIDPGTCQPVRNRLRSWAISATAAEADALSTAFMIMSNEEVEQYCRKYPNTGGVLAWSHGETCHKAQFGRMA